MLEANIGKPISQETRTKKTVDIRLGSTPGNLFSYTEIDGQRLYADAKPLLPQSKKEEIQKPITPSAPQLKEEKSQEPLINQTNSFKLLTPEELAEEMAVQQGEAVHFGPFGPSVHEKQVTNEDK